MVKKIILVCFGLFICSNLFAQSSQYAFGMNDSLHSKILDEDRRFIVYVPPGAHNSNIHYPVLYLFDAESQFTKTIGIIDHLSNTIGNEKCPQMIVVGIFHPNRFSDLIPPKSSTDSSSIDLFPKFLEKELIPYIDKRYPTQPFRVLVGHSLGGLRVIQTMLYSPDLFNSYIALDPSLGHVNGWIDQGINTFNQSNFRNKSLYIAMGHTMPLGMDTVSISKDTTGASRHMRCIMRFSNNAQDKPNSNLVFHWKYYPKESHQSVVFYGTYDGLISNFKWFENEKLYDIFKPEVSPETSVKIIEDYYARLSKMFSYKNIPPEEGIRSLIDYLTYKGWNEKALAFAQLNVRYYPSSELAKNQLMRAKWNTKKRIEILYDSIQGQAFLIYCKKEFSKANPTYNVSEDALNSFGYYLLQEKKPKEAVVIFKLNTELYPNSANVFDSYAECLMILNQTEEGIKAYKKSLALDPNNKQAKKIIESFESQK